MIYISPKKKSFLEVLGNGLFLFENMNSYIKFSFSDGNENAVEVYIHSLRGKLKKEGRPGLIQTRRGAGYILKEE